MIRTLLLSALFLSGCASVQSQLPTNTGLLGAWASGSGAESCAMEQITYFSSEGVVIDMYSKNGPFHAFGSWRREGNKLIITHNELPLDATGQSDPEITLIIVELDETRLTVRNTKGELRDRTKCLGIGIKEGLKDPQG